MKHISPYSLANGHCEVDEEADLCDPYSGIVLVRRCEICVVVLVGVRVAGMASSLCYRHDCGF
jgi:hypothetical protein